VEDDKQPGEHHRIELSFLLRTAFSALGFGGLAILAFASYRQYRHTGTAERDLWFYLHLPAYALTGCVCVGLVLASFSTDAWHSFARVLPPAQPDEDPWGDD
jgi:hypothetical protein